jgi:hypothetical protein
MTEHKIADEFIQALQSLFDWLEAERVPGTSIGGVAVSLLAQPRVTQDIDVVIWLEAGRWESFLLSGEKYGIIPRIDDALEFARRARVLLLRHRSSGVYIDISMGGLEFEREMIERAVTLDLGNLTLKVPTPEDLMITKAVAQRPKDIADIDAIASANPNLDTERIRYWVEQFASALEMPEIASSVENVLRHHSISPGRAAETEQPQKKSRRRKRS